MSKSFFLSGNRVIFVANADGADLRYRAHANTIAPNVQVPARRNERSETVFVVESGTLEFMIDGAVGHVSTGGFVRVPAGMSFAYRNIGEEPAHVLSRCMAPTKGSCSVTIQIGALTAA
ncbi:MAG: cupin domain-containing protein [Hyphomicrobiales bacterium]|nr:MAG: cupin domain-containing protein [Hyphomicrobiales bacterium]